MTTPEQLLKVDPGTLDLILKLRTNLAKDVLYYAHHVLSQTDYQETLDVIQEHIGLDASDNIHAFLTLHPILSARIVAFKANDTEVREEITNAVAQFTLGTDWAEDDTLKSLICSQWQRIWAKS